MSEGQARRLRSRGHRLLLALLPTVGFLALLAIAELVARWALPPLETLDVFVRAPALHQGFKARSEIRIFEGDPLLGWRLKRNLEETVWDFTPVSTNSQGLRYDRQLGPKPAGGFRIVAAGDSVTFGYRVPVVWPERPANFNRGALWYPPLLERLLREANPGREIEVIPLGVPGYSSHQGLAWLRRDLGKLRPDVVTLCYGWNDSSRVGSIDREAMPTDGWRSFLRGMASRSQLLLRAVRWGIERRSRSAPPGPREAPQRVSPDQYVENLLQAARLVEAHGAIPILVGLIYRDPEPTREKRQIGIYRNALRAAAEQEGIAYLEIAELTEATYPENAPFFGHEDPIHPNYLGHRVMARALFEFLSEQGALDGLSIPQAPEDE